MDLFSDCGYTGDKVLETICDKCGVEEIEACIKRVGEPYAEVLMYHFRYKMTIKQISQIIDENESTTGSRITRGRQKLKKLLTGGGYYG